MNRRRFVISTSAGQLDTTNTLREALRIVAKARGDLEDARPERRRSTRKPTYVLGNR